LVPVHRVRLLAGENVAPADKTALCNILNKIRFPNGAGDEFPLNANLTIEAGNFLLEAGNLGDNA